MDIEIKIDEMKIVEAISNELRGLNYIKEHQWVSVIYNAESTDIIYTVKERFMN